jgi:hypothetical protein
MIAIGIGTVLAKCEVNFASVSAVYSQFLSITGTDSTSFTSWRNYSLWRGISFFQWLESRPRDQSHLDIDRRFIFQGKADATTSLKDVSDIVRDPMTPHVYIAVLGIIMTNHKKSLYNASIDEAITK